MPELFSPEELAALELLPESGEVEFDTYKGQLYASNPDNGKAVFTSLLKRKALNRRLDVSVRPVAVYLSRKEVSA